MNLAYYISVLEFFEHRIKNVVASASLRVLCNSVRVEHNIKFYNWVQATIMMELDIQTGNQSCNFMGGSLHRN
jgi:hypothetical protein